jgi:hypothetical protein
LISSQSIANEVPVVAFGPDAGVGLHKRSRPRNATAGAVTVLAEIDRLARTALAASFLTDSRHPLQDLGRRYSAIKVS